jgi:glucosamine--fructose-6-phosphate aminotransferase (isomerizing)
MGEPVPHMLREIREQPAAVRRVLELELERVAALAAEARGRGVSLLYLAARGTSDHAAIYAKYLCEIVAGLPVALAAPSVYTLYKSLPRLDDALVLGISQSGHAADANAVLSAARAAGQLTACITNDPASPMAEAAEFPLYCHAGPEQSLPATKTYLTSLALVCALVATFAGRQDLLHGLKRVPEALERLLLFEPAIAASAERYRYMEECAVLARGINLCTALETGLKLSETTYLRAHAYSAADFLHGPIAVVAEGYPCLLIAPAGRGLAPMTELADQLLARGAELIVLSDVPELLARACTALPYPAAGEMPELLSPLLAIVPAQLFAFHLARVKGRDPDRPRGLRKVTHTV